MNVVIPLRGVALGLAAFVRLKITGLIEVVFQNEVDVAIGLEGTPHRIGQFRENVGGRVVDNGVNRVETQSVEMIFGQPVERIVNEEIADDSTLGAIEVDAVSPRSTVSIGKELWCVST